MGTLERVQYRVREPAVSPEQAAEDLLVSLEHEATEQFAAWRAAHPDARPGDDEYANAIGATTFPLAEHADIEVLAPLALTTFWEHVPEDQPAWYGLQGALRDAVYDSLQTYLEGKAGRVFEVMQ